MAIVKDDDEESGLGSEAAGGTSPAGQGSGAGLTPYTQTGFSSARRIIDKNAGQSSPNIIGGIQKQAKNESAAIKQGAQDYGKSLQDQQNSYNWNDDDINKGIGGGQEEFSKIQNILKGPQDVGSFNYSPNMDIQDINRLQTSVGAQGALKEQASARGNSGYSRGQASLDAYLFGQSPQGRQQQVGQALQERQNVSNEAEQARIQQDAAKAAATAQMGQSSQGLRDRLGGMSGTMQQSAQTMAPQMIQKAMDAAMKRDSEKYYNDAIDQSKLQARGMLADDPQLAKVLSEISGRDPGHRAPQEILESLLAESLDKKTGNYLDFDELKDDSYYDENSANQFNRVNELLGLEDRQTGDAYDPQGRLGGNLDSIFKKTGMDIKSHPDFYKDDIPEDAQAVDDAADAANKSMGDALSPNVPRPNELNDRVKEEGKLADNQIRTAAQSNYDKAQSEYEKAAARAKSHPSDLKAQNDLRMSKEKLSSADNQLTKAKAPPKSAAQQAKDAASVKEQLKKRAEDEAKKANDAVKGGAKKAKDTVSSAAKKAGIG